MSICYYPFLECKYKWAFACAGAINISRIQTVSSLQDIPLQVGHGSPPCSQPPSSALGRWSQLPKVDLENKSSVVQNPLLPFAHGHAGATVIVGCLDAWQHPAPEQYPGKANRKALSAHVICILVSPTDDPSQSWRLHCPGKEWAFQLGKSVYRIVLIKLQSIKLQF